MERTLTITEEYLYIPVNVDGEERKLTILAENEDASYEKVFEFMVPVNENRAAEKFCDYFAEIPVRQYLGRRFLLQADASEAFGSGIKNTQKQQNKKQSRPAIHFTADTGWTNDPNGLIYADGVYHMYFQYNPFHIVWNNMSWGHAVSTDLLHWKQEESVLFPDESGTMYSGCAIANQRGDLELPKDALLFFYTAAGGTNDWSKEQDSATAFTQKIAYSLDGGRTLYKIKPPCLPTVCKENRDPKVYWHKESNAYIMALWLEEHDFAIFRSEDLQHWIESDRFTLDGAWECPDIFCLPMIGTAEKCWFFWAADGYYYTGTFDGYHFHTDAVRHTAYIGGIPYAAQTFSGVAGRTISIPWLRMKNDGRLFTGSYGIPVELTCKKTEDGVILIQRPVCELMEHAKNIGSGFISAKECKTIYEKTGNRNAVVIDITAKEKGKEEFIWEINGSRVVYCSESGQFTVDGEQYQAGCGHTKFLFLVDDRILEIFFDEGIHMGTFILNEIDPQCKILGGITAEYTLYEVESH